jgi:hypothetical protein
MGIAICQAGHDPAGAIQGAREGLRLAKSGGGDGAVLTAEEPALDALAA